MSTANMHTVVRMRGYHVGIGESASASPPQTPVLLENSPAVSDTLQVKNVC